MESKYTRRMLDTFPRNLEFTNNKRDPLHIIVDHGGKVLSKLELEEGRKADNLFIDKCDPVLSSNVYYITVNIDDMDKVQVVSASGSLGKIVDTEDDFLKNDITGFDFVEELAPSGSLPSGILGLSYGFDWDDPATYITPSGSENEVYIYEDLGVTPESIDYSFDEQTYDNTGFDEYINFVEEIAGSGTLPSGVSPGDTVKVAYLNETPVADLVIMDAGNLKDPRNADSDGIIVDSSQYTVTGNRIVFVPERADYSPAVLTEVGDGHLYTYPNDYQPDKNFDSVFMVEYTYRRADGPRYLTQFNKIANVGKKENPGSSY